jgi:putative ABC transport system permease protein
MALLRSVGATRTQVLWSQLIEALLVGVMASVVGMFAGFGVAAALKRLLEGVGIDIPGGPIVLHPRTVIVAMTVGTVVTVASAVFPSLRASRVPPLAAIRATAAEAGAPQLRAALILGGGLSTLGVAAFVAGLAGGELPWVGLGALLTFLGAFTLGPVIARPAAVVFGGAASRAAGVVGVMARQNAARNPKRTARTGGALTVGVALVIAITVIAATAKDWTRDVIGEQFNGDFVVSTDAFGFGGLSPEVAARINELPEVAAAAGVRLGAAHDQAGDGDVVYVAVDPANAAQVFDLGMVEGSTEALTSDGLLIDDDEADRRDVGLGDTIGLTFIDGTSANLVVQGIYRDDDLAGDFVISTERHEATGVDQFDFSIYVAKAPGVSDAAAAAAIASVSDEYPTAELQSRSEYIDDQASQIDQIVNLMYGLLALAIVIALFNIANSVALSIHERTRELGLARAVGMTRHQTASSVRWEAAIVGLLGTVVGALLGLFFGWAVSVTLRGDGFAAVTVPLQAVAVIVAIGVAGGVLAAVRPAWRAAHLDVLSAIATE